MIRSLVGDRDFPPELFGEHLCRHFGNAAALEIAELEGAEGSADEAVHLKPQMLADLLHLAVLALADGDIEPGIVALRLVDLRLDRPIMDTLNRDAALELFERRRIRMAIGAYPVAAHPAGRRQFKEPCQFPVIGEKQQAFGVDIEPPDRDDARQLLAQCIEHGAPSLRILVAGDEPGWLVIAPKPAFLLLWQRLAVDADVIARLHIHRRRNQDLAVELDAAFADPPLRIAPRAQAGPGNRRGDPVTFTCAFLDHP